MWADCMDHVNLSFVSAQFAGEDPVVALEAALQFEDTRESMHAFCVGHYLEVRLREASATWRAAPALLCVLTRGGFNRELWRPGLLWGGGGCIITW